MSKKPIGIALLASTLAFASCRKPSAPTSTGAAPTSSTPTMHSAQQPNRPPIECPLAKQGIKTAHLRPFDDVEKYIAFLERPDRAVWQRPDAVVEALGLIGKETVVDVGAGSGYFSFRLAGVLPSGEVVATDIEPEMVRHMHHRAMTEGIRNIRVVLAKTDPELPTDTSLVFMCDVLHHVPDRAVWLGMLVAKMPAGSRLAMIEFKEGKLPEGPPEDVKIPKAELVALATRSGLVLEMDKSDVLPYQHFLVFRKRAR